jgi:8-oxo-dGTP pyrophosphatase MutT (NUDIX family)
MGPEHQSTGEEFNHGPESTPRQAATVILIRGGAEGLEVLLVRRTPKARFMGGIWVFPGGALEPAEEGAPEAHRLAAIRELHEEAAVSLEDPDALVEFSRWITPSQIKIRFDTRFFLAPLPDGQEPAIDGEECVDLHWFTPAAALDAYSEGRVALVFPTIKTLEQLSRFQSPEELLKYASIQEIKPVQPRLVLEGETARIVLPDDANPQRANP